MKASACSSSWWGSKHKAGQGLGTNPTTHQPTHLTLNIEHWEPYYYTLQQPPPYCRQSPRTVSGQLSCLSGCAQKGAEEEWGVYGNPAVNNISHLIWEHFPLLATLHHLFEIFRFPDLCAQFGFEHSDLFSCWIFIC